MTEFRAGDRVRVSNPRYLLSDKQRTGSVIRKFSFGYEVKLDNYGIITDGVLTFYARELTKIYDSSTDARLSEAESEIATLKAKVAALEKAQEPKLHRPMFTPVSAEELGRAMSHVAKAARRSLQTPNQRRADVIKRAQAFVTDLEKRAEAMRWNTDGNDLFRTWTTKLSFHVNSEKGVVTALAHGRHGGKLLGKAFAKCAPDDVFNADIGKAIAAGRLYGVDIPKEFTDAPKPTELVQGHVVEGKYVGIGEITSMSGDKAYLNGGNKYWRASSAIAGYVTITDDTDAVYE